MTDNNESNNKIIEKPKRKRGRPRKYFTEEDRIRAIRQQQAKYQRKKATKRTRGPIPKYKTEEERIMARRKRQAEYMRRKRKERKEAKKKMIMKLLEDSESRQE